MYNNLKIKIDQAIKQNVPDSVLFSGGIDSSAVLYTAHKYNPDVMAITVGVKGKETSDIKYSKMVAKELGIKNHRIFYVEQEKVKELVKTSVKMYAKHKGLKSISSGEGADDLLGSFPFFKNWKGDLKSLDEVIRKRLDEIVVMSDVIAKNIGIEYIAPFQNEEVKKEILNIPIEERMRKEGEINSKYPLRKAYENILPEDCIIRPQTMAFTGSGIYDTIKSIGNDIDDKEYIEASKNIFKFKNKFEYALFKIYNKNFEFKQEKQGGCIHCKSNMGENKINCKTCATLQIDGKELEFDGER